ncbi:MAG: hypothetical protein BRD48_01295 [Bacteroidetes bacterium QS_9_68_14]|nr:MAG: hypothetical protein BRD48_01295 [Bacteroidetes bacterium QS_9_68_14]
MPASAQPDDDPSRDDFRLSEVQWERRVLLLFAPAAQDARYRAQLQRLRAAPDSALAERDLLLVTVPAEGEPRRRSWEAESQARPVSAEAALHLRERFGVADEDFAFVLVGKDGTEKRRDRAPVAPEAIFEEIDAMPMRQREMRERQ